MGQPAFTPGAHSEAVGVLLLPEGTGRGAAGSGFSQIRAGGTPIQRRSDHRPGPVLQALGTACAALGPAGELGDDAVPGAGHQAGLLGRRLRCEILTDLVGHHGAVQLLEAADAAALQPVLGSDTSPSRHLTAGKGGKPAPVPSRNLPLEQLQVPVADFKAPPVVFRLVLLVAVGVEGRPALQVGAPDRPAPNTSRAAVAYAPSPVPCKREAGEECPTVLPLLTGQRHPNHTLPARKRQITTSFLKAADHFSSQTSPITRPPGDIYGGESPITSRMKGRPGVKCLPKREEI